MRTELVVRFDYGSIVPWVRKTNAGHGIRAIAGPDSIRLQSGVPLNGENLTTVAEFDVAEGDTVSFVLTWNPSHARDPVDVDASSLRESTERAWRKWSAQCKYEGPWRDAVVRSLVTLKGLTHTSTGGIVAAPTTSLPEALGGQRNWDYRYCWVRDATFTLLSLMHNGFAQEASDWRQWLLRAVAGDPSKLQIMYGIDGERRLGEQEIPWLPGYGAARPVRTGNAAFGQRQLDVYGEVMDALFQFQLDGVPADDDAWNMRRGMLEFLETCWDQPDEGIWEVRGPARNFTHSKVMAWVAFDRAVRRLESLGRSAEDKSLLVHWRTLRERMHKEICDRGFDSDIGAFVQSYGSKKLDASVLMIPLVGFLPPTDPRVIGTAQAIEARLLEGGLVRRYESDRRVDGLPGGEGVFLPCSFWLADNWALMNRGGEARDIRAPPRAEKRRRAPLGRVRPCGKAAGRKLSAGLFARIARQYRAQPERAPRFAGEAAQLEVSRRRVLRESIWPRAVPRRGAVAGRVSGLRAGTARATLRHGGLVDGLLKLKRRIPNVPAAGARNLDHLGPHLGQRDEARGADDAFIRNHAPSLARLQRQRATFVFRTWS